MYLIKKWSRSILVFWAVLFLTACTKEEEATPNCNLMAEEISSLILRERLSRTSIEVDGRLQTAEGTPTFDGCIMKYETTFYNLEQLVSFEAIGNIIVLRFP